ERVSALAPDATVDTTGALQGPATAAVEWLIAECGLDHSAPEQVVPYMVSGRTVLGTVPTTQTVIAERFFDEGGGMQLVIHAPFGGRVNNAWGLAPRERICRSR